jgi:predicted enzyme related to lactoylglutathione lyase
MTCHFVGVCFDANDPQRLARFWAELLGWDMSEDADGVALAPTDDTGFGFWFLPTPEPRTDYKQMHFHLTSTSLEDQQATVARSVGLGARLADFALRPEERHVALTDPEGNEFCVIGPGNRFLAGCGFFAEVSCEGRRDVGNFWSAALGWPLVWDQDEETAIRSPHGGPKLSWGGYAPQPGAGKDRLHFHIAPPPGGDQRAEVERLIGLGATRVDIGQGDVSWVVLADPDGHEFCVLAPASPPG